MQALIISVLRASPPTHCKVGARCDLGIAHFRPRNVSTRLRTRHDSSPCLTSRFAPAPSSRSHRLHSSILTPVVTDLSPDRPFPSSRQRLAPRRVAEDTDRLARRPTHNDASPCAGRRPIYLAPSTAFCQLGSELRDRTGLERTIQYCIAIMVIFVRFVISICLSIPTLQDLHFHLGCYHRASPDHSSPSSPLRTTSCTSRPFNLFSCFRTSLYIV